MDRMKWLPFTLPIVSTAEYVGELLAINMVIHMLLLDQTIDSYYIHGVSVTHSAPRNHIWTLTAGVLKGVPYSWKFSRDPIFAVFAVDCRSSKIKSAK